MDPRSIMVLALFLVLPIIFAQKITRMEFYMHDLIGTDNATTVLVAAPNNSVIGRPGFGSIYVFDDKLTEAPSIDSKFVGRAKGIFVDDSLTDDPSIFQAFTMEFEGRNGSLSLQGQNHYPLPKREISIVSGTGEFRFVQGYATISTHSRVGQGSILHVQLHVRQW